MRIRLSHLRQIIKEEVLRITEGTLYDNAAEITTFLTSKKAQADTNWALSQLISKNNPYGLEATDWDDPKEWNNILKDVEGEIGSGLAQKYKIKDPAALKQAAAKGSAKHKEETEDEEGESDPFAPSQKLTPDQIAQNKARRKLSDEDRQKAADDADGDIGPDGDDPFGDLRTPAQNAARKKKEWRARKNPKQQLPTAESMRRLRRLLRDY